MSDEFALCWNNFTDNISSGFHSLISSGHFCDVTIAVDGTLLKAHKLVLSICSPYFQDMFVSMPPNLHPILILKDMSAALVSTLLEFMYQGSVNVKQDELQAFMKIAETLQIKGLTTTTTKDLSKIPSDCVGDKTEAKRWKKQDEDIAKVKKRKEAIDLTNDDDADQYKYQFQTAQTSEVSMEPRLEDKTQKLNVPQSSSTYNIKIFETHSLNNMDPSEAPDESNLLVEIPSKSSNLPNESITMLSSTSLLHGNCIFNRNNTVATQAGLKTYWLCKSYRVSMCKARCITHQGKVISATGVHNHPPHMDNKSQEIPQGHTSNAFSPSTANDYLSLSQSTSFIGQSILSQQSNNYYSPAMYQSLPNRHVIADGISEGSKQVQCKMEQF